MSHDRSNPERWARDSSELLCDACFPGGEALTVGLIRGTWWVCSRCGATVPANQAHLVKKPGTSVARRTFS